VPQEIGEIYKTIVPSLSDDASIEKAFEMYHYGTASYNGTNLQPRSIEKHFIDIGTDISNIRADVANLPNVFIEEVSQSSSPNVISSQNSTTIPLTIRGVINQTAVLQRWQRTSEGGSNFDVVRLSNGGAMGLDGYLSVGSVTLPTTTALNVAVSSAAHKAVVVRGADTQAGNLQEWQNNLGTVLASVDPAGNFAVKNTAVSGSLTVSTTLGVTGTSSLGVVALTGALTSNSNISTTTDISGRKITLTGTPTSIDVSGKSLLKSVDVDGTLNVFGAVSATGNITTTGDLSVRDLNISQNMTTTGNLTANGLILAQTPNQGTTGAIRIRANGATNNSILQFVNAAANAELANITVASTGAVTISKNTSVLSPVGSGSRGTRNVYISTANPPAGTTADSIANGFNGDLWVRYV